MLSLYTNRAKYVIILRLNLLKNPFLSSNTMKNKLLKLTILALGLCFIISDPALGASIRKPGYILLQVQQNGEAWYVYPNNNQRYYLGRPADAFTIMKKLSLGAKHDYIADTEIFPSRLSGLILLDVERNGEAYYIYPGDRKKYYLGRPADAFTIMRNLGLGITNADLNTITIGDINEPISSTPKILQVVPFTSQAPLGNWSDLRQEDGCEEASALMAVKWARGEKLTAEEALKEITASSDYTLEKYKEFRDLSVPDTLNWVIKDYFNYQNAAIKKSPSLKDIITELEKGNLIIAPMNGRSLHNPYYTPPGPMNHMLVIKGYDPARKVFITNDPGTRHGNSYEYDENLLFESIRDYETGNHENISVLEKDVIVVWK